MVNFSSRINPDAVAGGFKDVGKASLEAGKTVFVTFPKLSWKGVKSAGTMMNNLTQRVTRTPHWKSFSDVVKNVGKNVIVPVGKGMALGLGCVLVGAGVATVMLGMTSGLALGVTAAVFCPPAAVVTVPLGPIVGAVAAKYSGYALGLAGEGLLKLSGSQGKRLYDNLKDFKAKKLFEDNVAVKGGVLNVSKMKSLIASPKGKVDVDTSD